MTSYTQENAKLLTPDKFYKISWNQLLIRALVQNAPIQYRPQTRTQTKIQIYSASHGSFLEVIYIGYESLLYDYMAFQGLDAKVIGGSGECADEASMRSIISILGKWADEVPLWLCTKPVTACRKMADGTLHEISSSSLHLMQHYARLQTRLAYEITRESICPHGYLCGVLYRLGAFIEAQNKLWERTIGVTI